MREDIINLLRTKQIETQNHLSVTEAQRYGIHSDVGCIKLWELSSDQSFQVITQLVIPEMIVVAHIINPFTTGLERLAEKHSITVRRLKGIAATLELSSLSLVHTPFFSKCEAETLILFSVNKDESLKSVEKDLRTITPKWWRLNNISIEGIYAKCLSRIGFFGFVAHGHLSLDIIGTPSEIKRCGEILLCSGSNEGHSRTEIEDD